MGTGRWPLFAAGGLPISILEPRLGCVGTLGDIAVGLQAKASGTANMRFSMDIHRPTPQAPSTSKATYGEVMHNIHGRNVWEADQASLRHTFAWLGIDRLLLYSPSSSPAFIEAMVNASAPNFVLEVGTFLGKTTIQMAEALNRLGRPGAAFVLSLDSWLGDAHMWSSKRQRRCSECPEDYFTMIMARHGMPMFYYQYLYNVIHSRVQHRVIPLPLSTNEAARVLHFHDWHPDLVYIDASHHALDVLQDLEHFWFLLECGGTMFGDDWHWEDVRSTVTAFACKRNLTITTVSLAARNTKWILWNKAC